MSQELLQRESSEASSSLRIAEKMTLLQRLYHVQGWSVLELQLHHVGTSPHLAILSQWSWYFLYLSSQLLKRGGEAVVEY